MAAVMWSMPVVRDRWIWSDYVRTLPGLSSTAAASTLVLNAHNAGDQLGLAKRAVAARAGMVEVDVAQIGIRLLASHDVLSALDPRVATLTELGQSWSIARRAGRVLFDLKSNSNAAVDQLIAFVRTHKGPADWFSTSDTGALERVRRGVPHSMRLLTIRGPLALARLLARSANPPMINGVSIEQHLLTRDLVVALRRRGLWIQAYVVDQLARINTLTSWGVTGITTNDLGLIATLSSAPRIPTGSQT